MPDTLNLGDNIEKQLPAELVNFMHTAGEVAQRQKLGLYLVGGVVRDLLLGRTNLDLDFVVEGDAIALARGLLEVKPGKITTHPRFGTAKLRWHKWSVDLATARTETYPEPGALPRVEPASLTDDLFRRDFSINAMAVNLDPAHYGELIDPYGGRGDLKHRLIRVLHERSFSDDATRIWRGLRYEQRLDFQLEKTTLRLLKRDIPVLDAISGDRIRYELECIFGEERPEKVLRRAEELGVLKRLHPALRGNGELEAKFGLARRMAAPGPPSLALYLALFTYRLTGEQVEHLISYLRLPRVVARTLRDTVAIKIRVEPLASPELSPSGIYRLLQGYSPSAVMASSLAADSPVAGRHLGVFLSRLRYVRPALSGDDLIGMGVTPGPRIKEILDRLHQARLDGQVASKRDEQEMVEGCLTDGKIVREGGE